MSRYIPSTNNCRYCIIIRPNVVLSHAKRTPLEVMGFTPNFIPIFLGDCYVFQSSFENKHCYTTELIKGINCKYY